MTKQHTQIHAEINGSENQPILLTIQPALGQKSAPLVILAHGFKAHKDWGFLPEVANQLVKHGFHTVRFSISHSGTNPAKNNLSSVETQHCCVLKDASDSQKPNEDSTKTSPANLKGDGLSSPVHSETKYNESATKTSPAGLSKAKSCGGSTRNSENGKFTRPDLFRKNTINKEISDFKTVIKSAVSGEIKQLLKNDGADVSDIFLFGHSRGAATAIISASELLDEVKIAGIACWSPIAHFMHYTKKQFADWLEHGFIEILEPRTRTRLIMDRIYRDDMFDNAARYDLEKATKRLADPNCQDFSPQQSLPDENCATNNNGQNLKSRLACPMLLLRGSEDKYIAENEMLLLEEWSNNLYELETISGTEDSPADHNFGIFNPIPKSEKEVCSDDYTNTNEALKTNPGSAQSTSTTIEQPASPIISWATKRTIQFLKTLETH